MASRLIPRLLVVLGAAVLGSGWVAHADPAANDPTRPAVPLPIQRPMPADPARVSPIGGARISSTTPQGETAGLEPPLAAQAERGEATVPMWAKDGIFAPTAHPNRQISIHLPTELVLGPAAWLPGGGAVYGSADVDYTVVPYAGGGVDITVTRKSVFSASTIPFGIKLPAATHLRSGPNVVLVETDATAGNPSRVIGTFSVPAATDANQAPLSVTPTLGPGFPPGQSNLMIDLGPVSVFAFPVTIALSYRASDVPTTGAPSTNWQGLPPGVNVPAAQGDAHCQGGPDVFTSADGRVANFVDACATQQQCLATTPAQTSVDSCNNRLLAHMSIQCTTVFGQTGDDYDACTRAAADYVAWVKTNMTGGPR